MKNLRHKILEISVFFYVFIGNTHAASISLEFDQTQYRLSDSIVVDVVLDSTDEAILAGGFDIFISGLGIVGNAGFVFNSAFLGPVADPAFSRVPDDCSTNMSASGCGSANELNGLGFGNFSGISGVYVVGTLTFDALAAGVFAFTMADNDVPTGGWFNTDNLPMTVDYLGSDIVPAIIPLPGAVWLMMSGLGFFLRPRIIPAKFA